MVRDPGRAPSVPPPSQGGRPDRQERHRTHGTSAGGVRPTPSTVSGGRPLAHPVRSSGRGTGTTAPTRSIPAPATCTVERGSIGRGSGEGPSEEGPSGPTLDPIDVSPMFEPGSDVAAFTRGQMQDWISLFLEVKFQQFATEMGLGSTPSPSGGGASTEQEDTTRRRRSRSSHADDTHPHARRRRRSSPDVDGDLRPQLVPLVELEIDEYGIPEGDGLKVLGTMVREVCRLYLPDDAIWSAVPVNQRYQILDIAMRLAAKYGPVSVRHKNAKARVERRREKNVMVTNPYGHQGFSGFRVRFKKAFGVYPEPKHNAFLRAHGRKRVFEFMMTGRDFPEVGSPSSAEVGADDTAGADDGADDDVAAAAAGSDVGADDNGAEFSELEGNGDEFEEDDQGQAPQQERVEELEDAEDDEEDEDSSVFEIREALRVPVQPPITEAQRIIRFVTGGESSAPRTIPQPAVLQAIPLDVPSGVSDYPASCTDCHSTDRHSAAPSCTGRSFRPFMCTDHGSRALHSTDPSSYSASARGTEERRAKKKKSKK
ncbi:hypothetical protein R1sor_019000 [Riccia sorocarpa]|uniref:Uncharacterized protein n=1 Tax=Riccia sorocarpa TaxID=122646 RepID=A0ABD3IBC9_9MARC